MKFIVKYHGESLKFTLSKERRLTAEFSPLTRATPFPSRAAAKRRAYDQGFVPGEVTIHKINK